jgi:hypothetical protein
MRPTTFSAGAIADLLRKRKIATLPELMAALGSQGRRTIFRKLNELPYRTSYSHRGRYYTLDEVVQFDQQGLWVHRDVWFSLHGTLLSTCATWVQNAECGHYVEELDNELHVATKDALRKLVNDQRLSREPLAGRFLYCAADALRKRQQLLSRRTGLCSTNGIRAVPEAEVIQDELRAAIVLFFTLLDEKQRRLYAGLEALKVGRGGDTRIAELLGIDAGTVARGRHELLAQDMEVDRVRKAGAGRKLAEKKRRK